MNLLTVLIEKSIRRNPIKIREAAFEALMNEGSYQRMGNGIFVMTGAKPNYLNYNGRWYLVDKAKIFDKSWLIKNKR